MRKSVEKCQTYIALWHSRVANVTTRQKCVFRIKHEVTKEHLSPIKYVVFNLLSVKIPIFSLFLKKQFDLFDKKTQNFCQSLPLKPPKLRTSESTGASVAGCKHFPDRSCTKLTHKYKGTHSLWPISSASKSRIEHFGKKERCAAKKIQLQSPGACVVARQEKSGFPEHLPSCCPLMRQDWG